MWNNLFDYWKGISCLGALSLSLAGWFFLNAKSPSIDWNSPLGYYTKLKLFIKRKNGTAQTASSVGSGSPDQRYKLMQASEGVGASTPSTKEDLLAEYPLTSLDKESYWRYCLPKNSQLQKSNTQATSVSQNATEECKMQWKSSASETINYLLRLGMDFFKLQHQMNLFLSHHLRKKIASDKNDPVKSQILNKCAFQPSEENEHYLKAFFTWNALISKNSKNCLLTPREVELTLETNETTDQVQSGTTSQKELKLEELKKGKVRGSIKYSLSGYYGELHKFDWKNQVGNGSVNPNAEVLIELQGTSFELGLESSGSTNGSSNLKFEDLLEKYRKRELGIGDFW